MYFGGSWALSMIGHEPLPLRSLTPSFMECFKGIPNGGRVVVRVKANKECIRATAAAVALSAHLPSPK